MSETPTRADAAVAEHMAALGRLAGGVAHDFNNALLVISGYAEMLAEAIGDDPDSKEAMQAIIEAAGRAGSLTRQLLVFSRRQTIEAADLPIAAAVRALETRMRRLVPALVCVTIEADDPRAVACVDPEQLDQVVLNLVANASEAMPGGGTLTVGVRCVTQAAFVDASGGEAPPGDYVRLTVSDTGAGMDESLRSRIFEPFFTTKPASRGAGLLLSTVYGIVKNSGGYVDVTSTVGTGTTFEIHFPQMGGSQSIDIAPEPI